MTQYNWRKHKYNLENGQSHGIVGLKPNSVSSSNCKDEDKKAKIEKFEKEEASPVTVRYIRYKDKKEPLEAHWLLSAGEPLLEIRCFADHDYVLPKGFVNQINSQTLIKRSEVLDKDGMPSKKDDSGEKIHEFIYLKGGPT